MPVLFVCSLSFICGVACSTSMTTQQITCILPSLLLGLLILLLKRRSFSKFQVTLYLATFCFAVALFPIPSAEISQEEFVRDFSSECVMQGKITNIETTDDQQYRATVKLSKIKSSTQQTSTDKQVYVYTTPENLNGGKIGYDIVLRGKITSSLPAMNPGEFNLRRYYLSLGISGIVNNPSSIELFPYHFYPKGILHSIQSYASGTLRNFIGGENAEFSNAVLVGDRSGFSEEFILNSRKTGISHITAVSGMHVSILISFILILTKPFIKRRKTKAKIIIPILVFYMALSGFSPSVIRASVMGCCCMAGILTGRRLTSLHLLVPCAAIMLAFNPFLLYNPSFMLSFLSSAGLSVFIPVIKESTKTSSLLLDTLTMTLVANFATIPYVLYNFEFYSWIGLFVNILVVPLVSFVFIGSMLTVLFSFLPPVATLTGLFTRGICSLICNVIDSISSLSFGQIQLCLQNLLYIFACYLFLAMIYSMFRKKKVLTFILFVSTVSSILAGFTFDTIERNQFSATFLYVGQGDSTVINLPGGAVFLIDTGDVNYSGKSPCLEYLNNAGIRKIEGIIISHEDSDHAGAFETIVSEIPTEKVYLSENSLLNRDVAHITESAAKSGCRVVPVKSGDVLYADDVTFRFLFPPSGFSTFDPNRSSVVVDVAYKNKSVLFTGDITEAEEQLIPAVKCDVLKVAHHGSYTSTSEEFISRTAPKYAVISAGYENRYSHPASSTLVRLQNSGTKTFLTYKHGAVTLYVSKSGKLTFKTMHIPY